MGGRSGKSLSRLSGKSLGLDLVGERSGQGVVVHTVLILGGLVQF